MRRILRYAPLLVLMLAASPARAQIPSAELSTVDAHVVFCPRGNDTLHVIVRRIIGTPIPNADVALWYVGCAGFHPCPATGSDPYTSLPEFQIIKTVTAVGTGLALLPIRAGGGCASDSIEIYANGVLLARRTMVSPDQNGDGVVDGEDLGLIQSKFGSNDPTGDLNGDGVDNQSDADLLQLHSGHACNGATPTRRSTWGVIKQRYR